MTTTPLLRLLSIALLLAAADSPRLQAAQAVFSADGKELFLNVSGEAESLKAITVATKADRVIDLSAVTGKVRLNGLARARNGQLLIVTPEALFAATPGTRGQKICGFPARFVAADVACHEASGDIVIAGSYLRTGEPSRVDRAALLLLRRDEPAPLVVATEGLTRLHAPVFDRDGTLYFAGDDDLWVGRIHRAPVDGQPGAVLQAYRYAPLATPETRETPGGRIVNAIALLGDKVCVELASAADNTLVRLPRAKLARERDGQLADFVAVPRSRWALHARVLTAAETLQALGRVGYLAATADESAVHFLTATPAGRRYNLLGAKDPKPRELLAESD